MFCYRFDNTRSQIYILEEKSVPLVHSIFVSKITVSGKACFGVSTLKYAILLFTFSEKSKRVESVTYDTPYLSTHMEVYTRAGYRPKKLKASCVNCIYVEIMRIEGRQFLK